jgi:hypothetical protein
VGSDNGRDGGLEEQTRVGQFDTELAPTVEPPRMVALKEGLGTRREAVGHHHEVSGMLGEQHMRVGVSDVPFDVHGQAGPLDQDGGVDVPARRGLRPLYFGVEAEIERVEGRHELVDPVGYFGLLHTPMVPVHRSWYHEQ